MGSHLHENVTVSPETLQNQHHTAHTSDSPSPKTSTPTTELTPPFFPVESQGPLPFLGSQNQQLASQSHSFSSLLVPGTRGIVAFGTMVT